MCENILYGREKNVTLLHLFSHTEMASITAALVAFCLLKHLEK